MRQLDVFEEPRRLHVVGMVEDEFRVLRGRADVVLAQFLPPQRAVHQRHGNRLALGLAEDQPIAARELGRLGLRPGELVHGLAFGQHDLAHLDGKPELGDVHLDRHGADPSSPTNGWLRP
jgi:hypothetical protein